MLFFLLYDPEFSSIKACYVIHVSYELADCVCCCMINDISCQTFKKVTNVSGSIRTRVKNAQTHLSLNALKMRSQWCSQMILCPVMT